MRVDLHFRLDRTNLFVGVNYFVEFLVLAKASLKLALDFIYSFDAVGFTETAACILWYHHKHVCSFVVVCPRFTFSTYFSNIALHSFTGKESERNGKKREDILGEHTTITAFDKYSIASSLLQTLFTFR